MGDKLKVAVLYDVWGEEAPESEKAAESGRKRKEKEDREEIFDALTKLGHEPSYHILDGRPQSLHGLSKCGADLVFNLTESYAGDDTKEMNVAAYMDLLGLPYTGAGPHAHFLAQDKATAKKMFAFLKPIPWLRIRSHAYRYDPMNSVRSKDTGLTQTSNIVT